MRCKLRVVKFYFKILPYKREFDIGLCLYQVHMGVWRDSFQRLCLFLKLCCHPYWWSLCTRRDRDLSREISFFLSSCLHLFWTWFGFLFVPKAMEFHHTLYSLRHFIKIMSLPGTRKKNPPANPLPPLKRYSRAFTWLQTLVKEVHNWDISESVPEWSKRHIQLTST